MFPGINAFWAQVSLILARAVRRGLKWALRRAQNMFIPQNINCITIIIKLETTEKIKKSKKLKLKSWLGGVVQTARRRINSWAAKEFVDADEELPSCTESLSTLANNLGEMSEMIQSAMLMSRQGRVPEMLQRRWRCRQPTQRAHCEICNTRPSNDRGAFVVRQLPW